MSNETTLQGEHFYYKWCGSPYEIGAQHGQALREEIIREYSPALDAVANSEAMLKSVVERYEPMFARHLPSALEEIHGLGDGSGLSYAHAFFAATRDGMKLPAKESSVEGCTAFYCAPGTTADGRVLIGQTRDTSAPLARYRIMHLAYDDGHSVLFLNYPGWIANIGMNSYGVACTGNSLYAQPSPRDTAPFSLFRRFVMQSQSVREVLDILDELPLENGCMLVADASGTAVCIESVAGQRDVRDISGSAFGHANSVLAGNLKQYGLAVLESPSSPLRQYHIQRLLNQQAGAITAETMEEVLADL